MDLDELLAGWPDARVNLLLANARHRSSEGRLHHRTVASGGRLIPHPSTVPPGLVNELMAARRAVRDAKNLPAIRSSRRRVNDAKIALGERGQRWWCC